MLIVAKKSEGLGQEQEPSSKEELQSNQDSKRAQDSQQEPTKTEESLVSEDSSSANTQSSNEKDTYTLTYCGVGNEDKRLPDKPQQTPSPNNCDESAPSTSEKLDHSEGTPDTVPVGKDEVFCATTGRSHPATGTPNTDAGGQYTNQPSADSARQSETPRRVEEPHTDSSQDETNSGALRTGNIQSSSQSTNDVSSIREQNTQKVQHLKDEGVDGKNKEESEGRT